MIDLFLRLLNSFNKFLALWKPPSCLGWVVAFAAYVFKAGFILDLDDPLYGPAPTLSPLLFGL